MARKRLYGETQKRRKKKQTQALKRQSSVTRVLSTHQLAPFQRSGEVNTQDVAFLEAMRDMGVKHYPRSGEAPVRRQKFETLQFSAAREDRENFLATMENLGVRPLGAAPTSGARRRGRPSRPAARPDKSAAPPDKSAQLAPTAPAADTVPAAAAEPDKDRPGEDGPLAGGTYDADSAPEASRLGAHAATTFQMDEDDGELMASVLRGEDFDPAAKFQGAPAPAPERQPSRPSRMETERDPDAELDLHGKTQEEAIHMVQNFLLTSYHRKLRHVLIITGRGHNSGAGGPVLRDAVYRWLELNGDRFAKAFAWAPARHGGEGAIWVVLR